ncbi:acyl-CoA dehydrogenase domain protein [Mycobacterium intracellulare]|nr:acyl-CoA dehydrogenase domain protein [Mycobacterium intracellulare]
MLAGKPFKKEAAIAKMIASEAAMDNARRRNADPRRLWLHERVPGGASLPATARSSKSVRAPPRCS